MFRWLGLAALSVPGLAAAQDCDPDFAQACVHADATVLTTESLGTDSSVGSRALVGHGVSFGAGAVIAPRATVHGSSSGAPITTAGTDFIVGRSAVIGEDAQVGNDVTVARSAEVGARSAVGNGLHLGYASALGADAIVGDQVVIGSVASIDVDVEIADGTVLARGVQVGERSDLDGVIGPDVRIHDSVCLEPDVRLRKQSTVYDRSRILAGAKVGRGVTVGAGAVIGTGAVIRANAEIAPGAVVPAGARVVRGEVFKDSTGDAGTPSVCAPLLTGVVHHSYNNPADPLNDDAGNGNDGLARTGTVDYSSGWAYFNGSSTYHVPSTANQSWANGLSVALWIRWSGRAGDYRGVVSNGYFNSGSFEMRFGRESSGTRLGVVTRGPSGQVASQNLYLAQNQWHHVAMVQGNGQWTAYLDGVVIHTQTVDWNPRTDPTALTLGNAVSTEPYSGDVDELYIYDRPLSAAEVVNLASQAH